MLIITLLLLSLRFKVPASWVNKRYTRKLWFWGVMPKCKVEFFYLPIFSYRRVKYFRGTFWKIKVRSKDLRFCVKYFQLRTECCVGFGTKLYRTSFKNALLCLYHLYFCQDTLFTAYSCFTCSRMLQEINSNINYREGYNVNWLLEAYDILAHDDSLDSTDRFLNSAVYNYSHLMHYIRMSDN